MVDCARHNMVWAALIGVLLQVAAPGWALSLLAARSLNPIIDAPFCSQHEEHDGKSAPQHQHGSLSPPCNVLSPAGYALFPAPPPFARPANTGSISHLRYSIAEPRAPPSLFAQARGPPSPSDMRDRAGI